MRSPEVLVLPLSNFLLSHSLNECFVVDMDVTDVSFGLMAWQVGVRYRKGTYTWIYLECWNTMHMVVTMTTPPLFFSYCK